MEYRGIQKENRQAVTAFIREQWLTTEMIIRGETVDMTQVDGIVGYENNAIAALLTYAVRGPICEITSFNSLKPGQGTGTSLIKQIIAIARQKHCEKVVVVTTNDNINAIGFYQKRGFDLARLYHNALDVSRVLKPSIPLMGENGIPLRHELEFEYFVTE